jgi:hypothetical protein
MSNERNHIYSVTKSFLRSANGTKSFVTNNYNIQFRNPTKLESIFELKDASMAHNSTEKSDIRGGRIFRFRLIFKILENCIEANSWCAPLYQ